MGLREGEFDVVGKTFLVTGGDKGLGFETVRRLLLGGGRVILACRDRKYFGARAEEETDKLSSRLGAPHPSNLTILRLDLSQLSSVREFSSNVLSRLQTLDVLICNAGVMSYQDPAQTVTEDGLEIHFAVNYLAHFYLVSLLRNLLLQSREGRVVVVSSILLKEGLVDTEHLGSPGVARYSCRGERTPRTPPAYADSKLMLALFSRELQRREPRLSVFTVSPGWCKTSLGRSAKISCLAYPALALLLLLVGRTVQQGADTIVFCAAKSGIGQLRGKFIRDREVEMSIENILDHLVLKTNTLWLESFKILQTLTGDQ